MGLFGSCGWLDACVRLDDCALVLCVSHQVRDDRSSTFIQTLRGAASTKRYDLVMFISPSNKKERYDALKKHCCLEHPGTQWCTYSRLQRF